MSHGESEDGVLDVRVVKVNRPQRWHRERGASLSSSWLGVDGVPARYVIELKSKPGTCAPKCEIAE